MYASLRVALDSATQPGETHALDNRLIEGSLAMHFVLLAVHSAEVCPTSNEKTRDLMLQIGPQVPEMAERTGVNIVAGPYTNREHMMVAVVEAEKTRGRRPLPA